MNLTNVIGGGLIATAVGWMACMLFIYFVPLSRIARVFVVVVLTGFALSSTFVGIAILSGGIGPFGIATDVYAVIFVVMRFVGAWTFAILMLLHLYKNNSIVETCVLDDTNREVHRQGVQINEMQKRGQTDQPLEQTDRDEGHAHRGSIDTHLQADTDLRRQERKDDREERAQERQADREERAEEQRDS